MKKNEIYKTESGKRKKSRLFSYFATFLMLSTLSIPLATQSQTNSTSQQNVSRSIKKAADDATYGTNIEDTTARFSDGFTVNRFSATRTDEMITYTATFTNGSEPYYIESYLLGYYGDNGVPFTMDYKVTNSSNEVIEKTYVFEGPSNSINPYYGVGELLGGASVTFNLPFEVGTDETLDLTSVVFYNIFPAYRPVEGDPEYDPNITRQGIKPRYASPMYFAPEDSKFTRSTVQSSDKLLTMKLASFTTLNDYTVFNFDYVTNGLDSYLEYATYARRYNDNKAAIDEGRIFLRYTINNLVSSFLRITYKDGTVNDVRFNGSSSTITIREGEGRVRFLLEKIDVKNIVDVEIKNLFFAMDLYIKSTNKTVSSSSLSKRFDTLYFDINEIPTTNVTLQLVLEISIFVVVFIAATVGIYLYQKNKYKNDEFRRVNNKKFIKTTFTAFIALISLFLSIVFITYRLTLLFNHSVVYNPCDIPICIFVVVSIIMTGYFIKFFFNMYKNYKTKKMVERLKLDENKDDDGTN